jgi:transposase
MFIMTTIETAKTKNIAYQHNKKTGATYVYSVHSYWDKEKKAPRNKQVYLGKLDPETGRIIPSTRRKPRSSEAITNNNKATATARVAGPSLLLNKIAEDTGLASILKKCFPELHQQILSIAFFITQKGLPLSRCETWSTSHLHPFDAPIPSQRVSELLRSITEDDRQRFLSLWLQKITEDDYLCYDITSISSYAQGNEFVRYGYNRDGEQLPQVNMAMLFGQKSHLPAYYRRMQGNISDVATLKTTVKSLDFLGASNTHFVLDRGFYSQINIDELLAHRHHFTIAVPSGRKWVEALIDKHVESIASPSNYREVGENEALYMSTVLYKWGEEKRRTYLHLYYNASRAGEEYDRFTRKLLKVKEIMELGTISDADRERYSRYFIVKDTPKRGRSVIFDDSEIQKYRNRYAGFFCILSSKVKDPAEALRIYRSKEVVENSFDDLKNHLDMKRLRVHDPQAMDSRFFLQFLSLIFVCHIRNMLLKHEELKNLTVRETMELLEPIVRIKYSGRYGQLYTETGPKQRNIFAAFAVKLPVS